MSQLIDAIRFLIYSILSSSARYESFQKKTRAVGCGGVTFAEGLEAKILIFHGFCAVHVFHEGLVMKFCKILRKCVLPLAFLMKKRGFVYDFPSGLDEKCNLYFFFIAKRRWPEPSRSVATL